ncbi:hypothetical protein ACFYY8_29235 [Streptosporangium sp. NPDC001559]|uniref:restriction endonuclease subunit S n=1 Tax=Streptosporangium sp. NPDC001559 TaxID=3366187 RepID=UPI0036E5E8CB
MLKTSAVYGGIFSPEENKQVDAYDLDRVSCPVLAGSLIVSRMNTKQHLGVAAAVGQGFPNLYLPDRLWAVRFNGAEPRFVDWWTKTPIYRSQVEAASVGTSSSMQNISQGDFLEIRIDLPDLETQRAVADYLDRETARIDTLIEEQQRLIEMLRERRQAAIEEAVSIIATSGARLKHIIRSVRQGWSPQCYSWPADGVESWAVLKAGAANGGRFRPMENKELPEDEIPRLEIVVTQGDLIVSRANTRELVGSAAVVEGDFPRLMLCDKLYAFSLDESRADSRFVAIVLGSRRWRDLIELEATGASHSMLNISQSDIGNLPMPLPPVDEQRRIVSHLDSETSKIDQLIAETQCFIELAYERRSALITAAVTGQIDVREAV